MKKYIFLLAAAAITLSACDDILYKEPKSQLSPESYFRTATDLQLFTNPLYNNLLPKSIYSEQSDQYINDNPSNLIRGGTFSTVPASGGGWTWTDLRRINTCLDYIPKQCEDRRRQYSTRLSANSSGHTSTLTRYSVSAMFHGLTMNSVPTTLSSTRQEIPARSS